jgi:hypothetical protein
VEPIFPCFVILGRVTSYTEKKIDEATTQKVQDALQAAIESGGLEDADNRLLGISWRDINEFPITDDSIPDDDNGGGNNGGGNGGDSNGDTNNDDGNTPDNDLDLNREEDNRDGLETWSIVLIGMGGAISCCMAYFCLRRPTHNMMFDDDDGKSSSGASGSSSVGSDAETSKKDGGFVPPMPIYHPPINPDAQDVKEKPKDPYNFGSTPKDQYNLGLTPAAATQGFQDEPKVGVGSPAPSVSSVIEEESDRESSDSNLSSNEGGPQDASPIPTQMGGDQSDGHITLDLEDELREDPSAISIVGDFDPPKPRSFGEDNKGDDKKGRWEENFVATAPQAESTEEEFSSEYSEEEVEEEYEIEYVEEEGGLPGVEEESEESSDESGETGSWEDEVEEEVFQDFQEAPGMSPILPWLASNSSHSQ